MDCSTFSIGGFLPPTPSATRFTVTQGLRQPARRRVRSDGYTQVLPCKRDNLVIPTSLPLCGDFVLYRSSLFMNASRSLRLKYHLPIGLVHGMIPSAMYVRIVRRHTPMYSAASFVVIRSVITPSLSVHEKARNPSPRSQGMQCTRPATCPR